MSRQSQRQDIQAATLSDLTGMMQRLLAVDEREAHGLAQALYLEMRQQWGGRQVHFHKVTVQEQADRILAAWRGDNVAEVCARFGISRSLLYRLLAGQRSSVKKSN